MNKVSRALACAMALLACAAAAEAATVYQVTEIAVPDGNSPVRARGIDSRGRVLLVTEYDYPSRNALCDEAVCRDANLPEGDTVWNDVGADNAMSGHVCYDD